MAQFDVCVPVGRALPGVTYLVVLQNDIFEGIRTTVAAPLRRRGTTPEIARLTPLLSGTGETLVLSMTEVVSLPAKALSPAVANLSADRERIIAALDMLFTGI